MELKELDVELREYQEDAIRKIDEAFSSGLRKILICVPTGGGKTIIFNYYSLIKELKTLVIAHRDELLTQAIDKYVFLGGDNGDCGVIKQEKWEIKPYTVASIQTLAKDLNRVSKIAKDYDFVVVDEAHHVCADTYMSVLKVLEESNPDLKFLGATATPFRGDKQSLKCFFQEQVFAVSHTYLMAKGYLVPVRGRRIYLPVDLDRLKLEKGDFSDVSLGKLIHNWSVYNLIVQKWKEYAQNRRTIFFLPMVENASELAMCFRHAGVPAKFIDGSLSLRERREVLREFREGRIRVLCNALLLTEGYDDPEVDCIGIVRPTNSLVLYAQIVGRGLRIAIGKKDCMILDFTGVSKRYSLVGLEHLFGMEDEETFEKIERLLSQDKEVSIGAIALDQEVSKAWLEVLEGNHTEEFTFEAKSALRYVAWYDSRTAVLSCGFGEKVLVLERVEDNKAKIYLIDGEKEKVLREALPEDYAFSVLITLWNKLKDRFMEKWADDAIGSPPTEKQIKYLKLATELNLLDRNLEDLNRLHASNLISLLKIKFKDRIEEERNSRFLFFGSIYKPMYPKTGEVLGEFLSRGGNLKDFPDYMHENLYFFSERDWNNFYRSLQELSFYAYAKARYEGRSFEELLLKWLAKIGVRDIATVLMKALLANFPRQELELEMINFMTEFCDGDWRTGAVEKAVEILNSGRYPLMQGGFLNEFSAHFINMAKEECLKCKPALENSDITVETLEELHNAFLYGKEGVFKKLRELFPNRTITQELFHKVWKVVSTPPLF